MIESGLYSALVVAAPAVEGRVYPVVLPQGVQYPALTYQLISDPRLHSLDGPDGLVEARYQISTWSPSYDEAKAAADDVRAGIDGFSGSMGTVTVARISHVGGIDLYDNVALIHQTAVDYTVKYSEE